MKSIAVILKENLSRLPYSVGRYMAFLPFTKRPGLGSIYAMRRKDLYQFDKSTDDQKKKLIVDRVKIVVHHAYNNVKFYKEYYDQHGFHPSQLLTFSDIKKIPIISKRVLQSVPLEDRSYKVEGRYEANTGGSTGKPLSFYITPDSMGHEWAHMHHIWQTIDYKTQDLKISFGGRTSGTDLLEYDSVRHSYNFNIYYNLVDHKKELLSFFKSKNVKFLHGYPSAIYEFSLFCAKPENSYLLTLVKKKIKGVFFGSEFPIELWRSHIEKTFDVESVSWYGHTERAVLAYEKNKKYEYVPFYSYGFAECISQEGKSQLVSTSYYNFASPLIRYNTEDVIKPVVKNELMKSFEISEGRIGEFVVDKKGDNVPLTGLIFGRHHKLFDVCSHIQVSQKESGSITILFTPLEKGVVEEPDMLFDSSNIEIDVFFKEIDSPIKTQSGKVKLLVK